MKVRFFCVFTVIILLLTGTAMAAPSVHAPAAILIDEQTGIPLFEKNADTKMYPASTTKIMTAILAIEKGNPEDTVKASFTAVNSISFDSSKICLSEGEQLTLSDLLYSLLIPSANDAANAIAEHISGSIDAFAAEMNAKAKELGAVNTHFVNPHGLHDENHYTTARDMALIAKYAMTLPLFRQIVSTRTFTIEPTPQCKEKRCLTSTNHLTDPNSPYYYEFATGIKTGYTDMAKNCLVSSAEKEGRKVIAVVMGDTMNEEGKTMSFVDSKVLLSYGIENLEYVKLTTEGELLSTIPVNNAKGEKKVALNALESVGVTLPEGAKKEDITKKEYIKDKISAPISKGEILGRMDYYYGDKLLKQIYMTADKDYERQPFLLGIFKSVFTSMWFYIIILIVLILYVFSEIAAHKRKSRRRRRADAVRKRNFVK